MAEYVVLVDEQDTELGTEEKLQAHLVPVLHRAFSVVIYDREGRLLMQQRAADKYHSAGLWSNTCCGHPRPGESAADAAVRRLVEEMGITCLLQPACLLSYRLELGGGLFEHELNRVFIGVFDGTPRPNPAEVAEWQWVGGEALRSMRRTPDALTPWLTPVMDELWQWSRRAESLAPALQRGISSWN